MISDNLKPKQIYTVKDADVFANGDIEVFADEVCRIQNTEVIFTDKFVQVFFSPEKLDDPTLFNETELEASELGSFANYRAKIQVWMMYIFNETKVYLASSVTIPHNSTTMELT